MESVKNAIEIRNVTKDYGDFKLDSKLLMCPKVRSAASSDRTEQVRQPR